MNNPVDNKPKFTQSQEKAIYARGKNLLVSASAGSGKTTVMIERVLSLLAEGESLENMVICTFTRSAAADMRDKLQNRLMRKCAEGAQYAEKQLLILPTAEINTLHSWCQSLIRNYFYVLDVDPAFDIADESEAASMLNEAIDAVIARETEAGDPDFVTLYDVMTTRRKDTALRRQIMRIFDFADSQPDPEQWLTETAYIGYNDAKLCDEIADEESRRVNRRFELLFKDLLDRTETAGFMRNVPAIRYWLGLTRGEITEEVKPQGRISEGFEDLNGQFKDLRDRYVRATQSANEYYDLPEPSRPPVFTDVLIRLTLETMKEYAEAKRAAAKLDFGDLEHLTVMLTKNERVLDEIKQKYRHIFVDEYQDINPLQERIISAVKGEGNLFLVGDVKQSIYAFRMCSPEIFLDKYLHGEKYGFDKPIELNDNFRSANEILDFCNGIFAPLMTERFGKIDYLGSAMLTGGRGLTGGKVELKLVVCKKKGRILSGVYSVAEHVAEDDDADKAEAETNLIAADIANLLSDRNVNPSDIAVLVPTRGRHVALLYTKLKKAGIPVALSDKLKFMSVHEVAVLTEFMKLLTDSSDDIALVSVLRSALIGLSDDELARIKLFGDRKEKRFFVLCERYASRRDDGLASKLKEFYALYDRYCGYCYTFTAGEVIGRLVAEKNWFAHVLSLDDGELKADALNSFLESVCASKQGGSVGEYVEFLRVGSDEIKRSSVGDSVTIMTVHAAKGLEFPYVFLANTDKRFNMSDARENVILDGELGVAVKNYDLTERVVLPNKLTYAAARKYRRKELEERMRLLYVAVTRAKIGLNIYACVNEGDGILQDGEQPAPDYEGGNSFFDWLRPSYLRHGFTVVDSDELKRADHSRACVILGGKPNPELVDAITEYIKEDYPHRHGKVKSSVTALNESAEESAEVKNYIAGENDDRAAEKGNAYHKAMELIDFNADFDGEWERLSSIAAVEKYVDKDKLRAAVDALRELTKGAKVFKEKQFLLSFGGMLVQGVIDLIAIDGEKCIIVDYKTSKVSTIESGAYDLQLSVYATAAERILGLKADKTLVYSFEKSDFIETKRVKLPTFEE